jgi:hypothetical protein
MRVTKWIVAACCLIMSTGACASSNWCGVNEDTVAKRVFAKVNDDAPWREFANMQAVPEIVNGVSAQVWNGPKDSLIVRTAEPGEDFWSFTDYCFDQGGNLTRIRFQLRTAWGWGFRVDEAVENSALRNKSETFFDTKTQKPIARPDQADDIREAMQPTIYSRVSRLPFSQLLRIALEPH